MSKTHSSAEPMRLARDIVATRFTEGSARTLVEYRGTLFHWNGTRWRPQTGPWLLDQVRLELEDATVEWTDAEGATQSRILKSREAPAREVADCIETVVRREYGPAAPFWLCNPDKTDPELTVQFRSGLVTVRGEVTGNGRGPEPEYFEPVCVETEYEKTSTCPLWNRCVEQWSGGDPEWGRLLQRVFGYCLLPTRKYQRWFLFHGVPRSGKGTVIGVLRRLLGHRAVTERSMSELGYEFGLDGLEHARVLVVTEVHELESKLGARVGGLLKALVGEDPITVNAKYQRQQLDVACRCVPILQANEIPTLPNQAAGLSSKMVVLPFGVCFLDREDEDLRWKLAKELPGIAAWAMEGARQVVAAAPGERWPVTDRAMETVEDYLSANSPLHAFLSECFEPRRGGFVAGGVIWEAWETWRRRNPKCGVTIGPLQILNRILSGSGWPVARARRHGGVRGLSGLVLRYRVTAEEGEPS